MALPIMASCRHNYSNPAFIPHFDHTWCNLGLSKKTEKPRKPEKKFPKKLNREKKPIKILKKPVGSVRFRFYKSKTKKTKLNRKNQAKSVKNRAKLKKPSQTGLNRFWP
jgi:hypothetical protein